MNVIDRQRRIQRLKLDPPLTMRLGSMHATVHDLSLLGAGVEHLVPLQSGSIVTVMIVSAEHEVTVNARVMRCTMQLDHGVTTYRSGLAFRHSRKTVPPGLTAMLTAELSRAIALWKANARGVLPESIVDMPLFHADDTVTTRARRKGPPSFIWYRWINSTWQMSFTLDPNQPLDGFAVSADDDQTEMKLLCTTYERSDETGRHLIRLLAHLSIASAGK